MSQQHFHGPINGHNVVAGIHTSDGGTVNFNYGKTYNNTAGNITANGNSSIQVGNNHTYHSSNRSSTSVQSSRSVFAVPFPRDPRYVKRQEVTEWLETSDTGTGNSLALVGLGGVGKSQIAIEYAYQLKAKSPNKFVFWVHAGSRVRLEEAYRNIAKQLKLPERDSPDANVAIVAIVNWLQDEENGPWLMILDSADDLDPFLSEDVLESILPIASHGSILVTCRNKATALKITDPECVYTVPVMRPSEALELLRNKLLSHNDSNEDREALVRTLDYVPLAICQAASYIAPKRPRASPRSYVRELQTERSKKKLLDLKYPDRRRDRSALNSVMATWGFTLNRIRYESPSAIHLLAFISEFCQQSVSESALQAYAELVGGHSNERFEEDLYLLRDYSFISMESESRIETYDSVRFCMTSWISQSDMAESWNKVATRLLEAPEFPIRLQRASVGGS